MGKSRVAFIRRFIQSGEEIRFVPMDDWESHKNVYNAIAYAIRVNPDWSKHCEVFTRRGKVFLLRKD